MTIITPPPVIDRDRYGRPMVVPPGGGRPTPYTRCTTYVSCLEDTFSLQKWMQRQVALGLSARPDLLLSVSAHRDDKRELDRIADAAREAAAASAAATTGTALHALTELVDRGQDLPVIPAAAKASLDAYAAATAELSAVHIERFTVLDTLRIGGTPDRIVEYAGNRYVADLKTGRIDYGATKIAMQLAVYARSKVYDPGTGERSLHEAETTRGIVVHLPVVDDPADARCELHWFDIEAGWYAVQVAKQVREQRKLRFGDLTEPFGAVASVTSSEARGNTAMRRARNHAASVEADTERQRADLAALVDACGSRAELVDLWTAREDEWTPELTERAKKRIADLPAAQAG